MKKIVSLLMIISIAACSVGPDYVRPKVSTPARYKEAAKGWKRAKPQDYCNRGEWWKVFKDRKLNILEYRLNCANQSIATAEAQYRQALAVVNEVRAGYFPVVTASGIATRQKEVFSPGNSGAGGASPAITFSNYSLNLNATWEPDLWGSVRRAVEASADTAQASEALLESTRLSMQATLAQLYYQLRNLDMDQKILDDNVHAYQRALKIAKYRYASGVDAQSDVIQAESLVEAAQAAAINNGVNRALYEHSIAVLVGVPASCFALARDPLNTVPPKIPVQVPSVLLERRPDIAQSERLMAAANAQVGVAIAAYFPVLTLTASGSTQGPGLGPLFSAPTLAWALGAQLVQTVFDGGLRFATTAAARANYDATVATYRQTVLAAFQNVEDNLSTLRILEKEIIVENRAVVSAKKALEIVINQYKSGTAALADVIVAETVLFTAEKNAADIAGQRMVAAVGLIKSLGGGWDGKLKSP